MDWGSDREKAKWKVTENAPWIIRGDKRDMKERGKSFKKLEGRPKGKSKQKDLVDKYRKYNPNETIKGCIEETGINRSAVYRWWKK